jgi:uncharacterized protein (DUF302 family)
MSKPAYGFGTTLKGVSFEQALERTAAALKEQGFGVLTEIDVQATLKAKLDVDFRRYKILGACNPPLAHKALSADDQIGLLLPCNVVVQEAGPEQVQVSVLDPKVMFSLVSNPAVEALAEEVNMRLRSAISALQAEA